METVRKDPRPLRHSDLQKLHSPCRIPLQLEEISTKCSGLYFDGKIASSWPERDVDGAGTSRHDPAEVIESGVSRGGIGSACGVSFVAELSVSSVVSRGVESIDDE